MRLLRRIKVRIRPWLFGFFTCLVLCITTYIWFMQTRMKPYIDILKIQVITMNRHNDRLMNISKTLQVAYRLSPYETDVYAFMLDKFVDDNAVRYKKCVPWEMYAAMFWTESRFKANLTSRKGAKGPGQMLDGTYKEQCKELGVTGDIWNYVLNMTNAAAYFSKHYDGGGSNYFGGPAHSSTPDVVEYNDKILIECEQLSVLYKGVQ